MIKISLCLEINVAVQGEKVSVFGQDGFSVDRNGKFHQPKMNFKSN